MTTGTRWQDVTGQRWAALSDRTDAQLDDLGRAAMARLAPAQGERALDVGCGAGQSTLQLADLVGPSGHVVGVDISGPLLGAARDRVEAAGRTNVELLQADAATARFATPFDVIYSRFGVMFFDDVVAAFRNLRDALVPGGRLGFVSWQPLESNPWASEPLAAVRTLRPELPDPAAADAGKPGPFYLSTPAFVSDILDRAGFSDVEVVPDDRTVRLGGARTLAEAVEYLLQIGPSARFLADAQLLDDPRAATALQAALTPFARADGVWVPARTLLVTARVVG